MPRTTSIARIFAAMLVVGLLTLLLVPLATHRSQAAPPAAGTPVVTFRPSPIPLSEPELVGSTRGLFKWNGQEAPYTAPLPAPAPDVYRRYVWRDIEPTKDHYDFSKLDALAAEARTRGGKFMFKIYNLCGSWCPKVAVPDYFLDPHDPDYLAKGWWYQNLYIPDWNDERFLSRAEKLLSALGQRYGNDPRLGLVEIGIYGNYGEWHTWVGGGPLAYPSATGAVNITAANKKRIIDMHARAFPTKQLVMLRGGAGIADAVSYAMSLNNQTNPPVAMPIGWAADCWGDPEYEDDLPRLPQWPSMQDRWKTAPVMGEMCNTLTSGSPLWRVLPLHMTTYHVSLLANGNIGGAGTWDSLTSDDQNNFMQAAKLTGHRYLLDSLTLPAQIAPGAAFDLSAQWSNVGVAPLYEPWNIVIQLRDQTNSRVVWQARSNVDLRTVLPANPRSNTETFQLPADIPAGAYNVAVTVRDTTTDYRAPLALGVYGRTPDGSYPLGSITVAATAQPSPTQSPPTAAPSATPTTGVSEPAPSPTATPVGSGDQHGLNATYYDNIDFTGRSRSRIDSTIDFNWRAGSPDAALGTSTFSAAWQGYLVPQYSEKYTFSSLSDDGMRVWINDQLIVDNWADHSAQQEVSGSISLAAGQRYRIKVLYYEHTGNASAKLLWSSRSQVKGVIPTSQLFAR